MSDQRRIKIGTRLIGKGQPTFIVAEAGVNHLGRRDLALQMVREAAAAGADAIKFQTCRASEFLSVTNVDYAEYRRTALSTEDYAAIAKAAHNVGLVFFSTPLDEGSVDLLARVGVPAYKVASCDLTHQPLLSYVASKRKPVILSTGMAELREVQQAVKVLRAGGAPAVAVLHCVCQYPADPRHIHLRAMATLGKALRIPIGLSDHTVGVAVPCAAVALGASIIEKHFTLDHGLRGDDHRFSCNSDQLRALVAGIRQVEQALGRPRKAPTKVEQSMRQRLRRIVVAARPLAAGVETQRDAVVFQRPDFSRHQFRRVLSSWEWPQISGRRLRTDVAEGEAITWDHLIR